MLKMNIKMIKKGVFPLISAALLIPCLCCSSSVQPTTEDASVITVEEAFDLIQDNRDNPNFIIIDVRTASEYVLGHIEKAINIDYEADDFNQTVNHLDKDKTYIVYCKCGKRGVTTLNNMKEQGFREAYSIKGGFLEWQFEKLPYIE